MQTSTSLKFLTWSRENQKEVTELKILTYNIFLRPPFIKNNKDDYKNERLEEFYRIIKSGDFDIIALQEIFSLGNFRPRSTNFNLKKRIHDILYHYFIQFIDKNRDK